MAVSAVARVIMTLFKKHGAARGASMAQKLGFKNKDIKSAFSQLGVKRKPKRSFKQRKEGREYAHIMKNDPNFNRRMTPRRGNPSQQRLTRDYQEMGPEQASWERHLANMMSGE